MNKWLKISIFIIVIFILLGFLIKGIIILNDRKDNWEEIEITQLWYEHIDYKTKEIRLYWEDDVEASYIKGDGIIFGRQYKIVFKDGTTIYPRSLQDFKWERVK